MQNKTESNTPMFYRVQSNLDSAPVRDYLLHGYESRRDFERALRKLVERWRARIGECVDERHGFLRLRFHDTLGGKPDEEWLPRYLLEPVPAPECYISNPQLPEETELDRIFGFD